MNILILNIKQVHTSPITVNIIHDPVEKAIASEVQSCPFEPLAVFYFVDRKIMSNFIISLKRIAVALYRNTLNDTCTGRRNIVNKFISNNIKLIVLRLKNNWIYKPRYHGYNLWYISSLVTTAL